jgi:hypothetical protein
VASSRSAGTDFPTDSTADALLNSAAGPSADARLNSGSSHPAADSHLPLHKTARAYSNAADAGAESTADSTTDAWLDSAANSTADAGLDSSSPNPTADSHLQRKKANEKFHNTKKIN